MTALGKLQRRPATARRRLRRPCSVCGRVRDVSSFWWPDGAGPDFLTLCAPCDRAIGAFV